MKKKCILSIFLAIALLMSVLQSFAVSSAEVESDAVSGYSNIKNNTTFYIKNVNSGQYLDLDHGKDQNNANIHQWKYNGQKNQQWKFVKVGTLDDGGLYKIVSVDSSSGRVIDVSKGGSSNNLNVALYQYKGSNNQIFALKRTVNGAYKILSKCSGYKSALTVKNKSCSEGANVIQYKYNGTHNDEWFLEPVNATSSYGVDYANYNATRRAPTYPDYGQSADCANFVSQCMVASGIHYRDSWYIYKENNKYLQPGNVDQLHYSWDTYNENIPWFASPWISAPAFGNYWCKQVDFHEYDKGSQIYNNLRTVPSCFKAGDVVQYASGDGWGFEAIHTMYITERTSTDFLVSYHSSDSKNKSLNEVISKHKSYKFRFYNMI